MRQQKRLAEREEDAERISQHVTDFFNVAFARKTRSSRQLVDAIYSALEDRYKEDEIRLAYWIARCVTGKAAWLSDKLRADLLPHIVLRHSGHINNQTGKPSVRWLDELLARAPEASPALIKSLLDMLPETMRQGEIDLLKRMEMRIGD